MEKCHGKHRLAIDFFVFISYIWRNIKRKSNDRIYKKYNISSIGGCAKLHMRITNGQETVKVLAHFCYNNFIEAAGNS